jgi:large subunit ribosomal protein L29
LKVEEARTLSDEELRKKLEESYKEFFDLRFRAATKQLKNHRELPWAKKKIARLKTVIQERELGIR